MVKARKDTALTKFNPLFWTIFVKLGKFILEPKVFIMYFAQKTIPPIFWVAKFP